MNNFLDLFQEYLAEFGDPQAALEAANAASGSNYTIQAVQSMMNPAVANTSKGLFAGLSGLRNKFGAGKSLVGGKINLSGLKGLGKDIRSTKLIEGGPTVSQAANTVSGIYQGGKALKGLYENIGNDRDLDSLKKDINLQIASNPMYDMYMDINDEKTLRQMNNGTLTNNLAGVAEGAMKGIPQAGLSALMGGITGGVPGALIGGLGSLINSGIQGYGQGTQEAQSKLQGLYDRLRQANEEYRTLKRPSGLRRAGLSTQYFNQLY